jgi:hypothetical protein
MQIESLGKQRLQQGGKHRVNKNDEEILRRNAVPTSDNYLRTVK